MGLAERRAAKAFEDHKFPAYKQEIDAIVGFDIPVEVNWEAIAIDDYTELYDTSFPKVYFKPLIEALKGVCIDDLGRDAVKAGLKKIVITNENSSWPTFQSGVLTLLYPSCSNVDDWADRKKTIQTTLEKGL
jgi:hypothetical protein